MKKVSINNLDEVRESLAVTKSVYEDKHRLDLIRIEISRECAQWLLADIDKQERDKINMIAATIAEVRKEQKK